MQEVVVEHNANNNVELGGRNTFKFFQFGISNILHNKRRVDDGWHIAMALKLTLILNLNPKPYLPLNPNS
jgi:hypothetical protein